MLFPSTYYYMVSYYYFLRFYYFYKYCLYTKYRSLVTYIKQRIFVDSLKMEVKNKKANDENLARIGRCLETSLYPSLVRVLGEAHEADAINHSHTFRQIFMNKLADDLWHNNPLHPERERTSVCNIPFTAVSNDGLQPSNAFFWGMSRDQAATVIQVLINREHNIMIY